MAKRNEQGDVYWSDQETWRKTFATDLPLEKGEATFRFDFGWGGRYLVAFTYQDDQGRSFASATTYQVAGGSPYEERENKEKAYQILPLSADRPAYEPGQTAKIALRPKRPVSCYLVTLEQEGLLQHRVVKAQKDSERSGDPHPGRLCPQYLCLRAGPHAPGRFPGLRRPL